MPVPEGSSRHAHHLLVCVHGLLICLAVSRELSTIPGTRHTLVIPAILLVSIYWSSSSHLMKMKDSCGHRTALELRNDYVQAQRAYLCTHTDPKNQNLKYSTFPERQHVKML